MLLTINNNFVETLKTWGINLGEVLGKILFVTIIALILQKIITDYLDKKMNAWIKRVSLGISDNRAETLKTMINNILKYTLYFVYTYIVLTLLGIPIGTLLAGAGIAGVAIGFGARDLVTDIVNGFFILFENQYEVGELVNLPEHKITGTIEAVGIRTTTLLAASGEKYFIRNSKITIVNNMSRHQRQIQIEIPLADSTDFAKVSEIIEKTTQTINQDFQEIMVDEPQLIGLVKDSLGNFNYRVTYVVQNGQQYRHESIFYNIYVENLAKAGINLQAIQTD